MKGYLEDRDDLTTLLFASNLAIVPSRTEGFGLTALEALSVGLPFLVSQNSGFGEAIQEIGPSFVVDSEVPEHWAEAIKGVRQKGSEAALRECWELRARYAEKFSWETQCHNLVKMMQNVVCGECNICVLGISLACVTGAERGDYYSPSSRFPRSQIFLPFLCLPRRLVFQLRCCGIIY